MSRLVFAPLILLPVLVFAETPRRAAPSMVETAQNFLAALPAEQKTKATFTFEDEERYNFHFIPRPRKGLSLKEMTPEQKHLAQALLSAGLSQRGYVKATSIMSLEEVLRALENDNGVRRNPEGYFFSVFGEPSEEGAWGYRVEGHHLSFNFTLAGGRVISSPNFMGTNPAEVRSGPRKGLRILHAEEDLARDLLLALNAEQKKTAVVAADAYPDILTMANRKASIEGQPSGLPAAKMTEAQRLLLGRLIREYTDNLPDELAAARQARIQKAGTKLFFAWAGPAERGRPHYYRVQGPDFLIEYDNTQNNANHVHSVWRDLTGDFGADLLSEHYRNSPHHKKTAPTARHRH